LLGADYVCFLLGSTLRTGSGWMFQGVPVGTAIPGFLAGEIDYVWPGLHKQPGLGIVASGTGTCLKTGQPAPMHATAYIAASGARVFNGSTFAYSCFLIRRCPSSWAVPTPSVASRRAVTTMVTNITEWVSRGAIQVPADTSVAALRVAVPQERLAVDDGD
jgi:hypothetical protein